MPVRALAVIGPLLALLFFLAGMFFTSSNRGEARAEFVTLHHLYVLKGDRSGLVTNPRLVYKDGFACQGDDELLRTEFVRDEETDLLMLACFWRQRY